MSLTDSELSEILGRSRLWERFSYDGLIQEDIYNHVFDHWKVCCAGRSYMGSEIRVFFLGHGEPRARVLLWSQMHGNEPFSTYALMLAMEFVETDHPLARKIRQRLELIAIPLLNPDGSKQWKRRNAQEIDINRDALSKISPEARLLADMFERFIPRYCFNMHDQDIYYAPAGGGRPTAMAYLVPAADEAKTLTDARLEAMDILGYVVSKLNDYSLAKYNDSFMPAAFGDYFSSRGSVTMLFETGYIIDDPRRRQTTLLHAISVIWALERIVSEKKTDYSHYYKNLRFNHKHVFFDVILKNVILKDGQSQYVVDIAINRNRLDPERFVRPKDEYKIFDIGNLNFRKAFIVKDFKRKLVLPREKIYLYAPANWLLANID